jgi:tRNA 2-thiouridine synthesizing protein B
MSNETLHILSKGPGCAELLNKCLMTLSADDHLLLIEDGVYWTTNGVANALEAIPCQVSVLVADLEARGISASVGKAVDDIEFVTLTANYKRSISWF